MAYTREQIEELHKSGKMPDWVYYQSVSVPAQIAVQDQVDKFLQVIKEREQEKTIEKKIEQLVEDEVLRALRDSFN